MNAAKLDFVIREKRGFAARQKLIPLVDFRRRKAAFSRVPVDVRGEEAPAAGNTKAPKAGVNIYFTMAVNANTTGV